jgi:hypothetical protein
MAEATKTLSRIPPAAITPEGFEFLHKSEHSPTHKTDNTRPTSP